MFYFFFDNKFLFQLHMYRKVHNLIPPEMTDENYQAGWIAAARNVGINESIIQKLAALARI